VWRLLRKCRGGVGGLGGHSNQRKKVRKEKKGVARNWDKRVKEKKKTSACAGKQKVWKEKVGTGSQKKQRG